ncbi:MAG: alpha/beta fold hydrolase [Acidobacteriota bacterium]
MNEPLEFEIPARDGRSLAASLYGTSGPLVVICPATAVRRRFYRAFAEYLVGRGFRVLTFDYRGVGGSLRGKLRADDATMRQWGELDTAGVLDWIAAELSPQRLLVVAHSVGGQLLGLLPNHGMIDAAVTISCQSGFWGHWPWPGRARVLLLWYLLIPAASTLCGYFPSKLFGVGENLPAGVARQWARWGRRPSYLIDGPDDEAAFADFRRPMRAYSVDDDGYAPVAAVDALHRLYRGADVERVHLETPLGHFGFFRRGAPEELWRGVADWFVQVGD